ncbi:hypothetical protein BDR05DRAFT_1003628 [Suillus weaverae]|nr:hypothetical protein BDR05DRAFT_1003628 [Suillus weaverae]
MSAQVEELRMRRLCINSVHIARLDAIEALPGFSGSCGCGNRQGGSTPSEDPALIHMDAIDEDGEWDEIAADDAWNEDVTHLIDILEDSCCNNILQNEHASALHFAPFAKTTTMHAPYAPPAIRQWVQAQENQPQSHDIDCQHFANRRGIRHDNKENLSSNKALHEHFCLNKDDQELAFHEGMSVVKDAAWDVLQTFFSLDSVEVVTSRQFEQFPHFKRITSILQDIFMQELSVAHIWNFQERLNQVTPGPGYVLDPLTRQLMTGNNPTASSMFTNQQLNTISFSATSHPYPPAPATSTCTAPPSCPYPPVPATSTHTAPPSHPYPPAPATLTWYHDHTAPPTAPPSSPHPPAPATLTQYCALHVVVINSDSSESESNSDSDHSDHGPPPICQLTPAHQPTITPHQLTSTSAQSLTPAHQSTNAHELSSTCQPTTTARIA